MEKAYYRPVVRIDSARPSGSFSLGGAGAWFDSAERMTRSGDSRIVPAREIPEEALLRAQADRAPLAGLDLKTPRLMGILNVTPDSFSDGGEHSCASAAASRAMEILEAGGDIIDIGGESTRPGAKEVDLDIELGRVIPAIRKIACRAPGPVISIDTRKAAVAREAVQGGARIVNDVSALGHDSEMIAAVKDTGAPVILMHSPGTPETMQREPKYGNVLLDVYDFLEAKIQWLEGEGIDRARVVVDPGIGFGKTLEHNLALLRGVALFHMLGCPVLVGVSRKGFIRKVTGELVAARRFPGSIAAGIEALRQGVQILRVHDIQETRQALDMWLAVTGMRLDPHGE